MVSLKENPLQSALNILNSGLGINSNLPRMVICTIIFLDGIALTGAVRIPIFLGAFFKGDSIPKTHLHLGSSNKHRGVVMMMMMMMMMISGSRFSSKGS